MKTLSFSVLIHKSKAEVWRVLTMPYGIRSYLAPDIHVIVEVGPYPWEQGSDLGGYVSRVNVK